MDEHRLMAISGPSGVGKSTLVDALLERFSKVRVSISTTTRLPRGAEQDGEAYHFVSVEQFERQRDAGDFIEWAQVHGNYYGTSRSAVSQMLEAGHDVLFDVDVQGVASLKAAVPGLWAVLIVPPSMQVLESRLRGRATETEEATRVRLRNARSELEQHAHFDFVVVNDVLEEAVEEVCVLMKALMLRRQAQPGFMGRILGLG